METESCSIGHVENGAFRLEAALVPNPVVVFHGQSSGPILCVAFFNSKAAYKGTINRRRVLGVAEGWVIPGG